MFRRAAIFVHKKEDDIMGELRTRKRGKNWEWSFEGARIGGKRNSMSKGGYHTKAEAVAAGTQAKAEYDRAGRVFSPADISVSDYLDYWLKTQVITNMAHNTYLDYEGKIRNHIKPQLGAYRLAALAPDIIQKWVNEKKKNGLSWSSVSGILSCLSSAMNYAMLPCKYIQQNPCTGVKIGKINEDRYTKEHREYVIPQADFLRLIERFPENSSFYLPLILGYHLGTRLGETYGFDLLTDVDFGSHTIRIERQMQKENGGWFYRPPKYDSFRTVKMGETLESVLRRTINARKKNMLLYGQYYTRSYIAPDQSLLQVKANIRVPYQEIMPACIRENGEILTPESFKYCARVAHTELGLPLFHSHSLRHTHGTILAENGVFPKTIMERLGHKDIKTTLQTYIFNTDTMQQDAVSIFETALAK